MGENNDLIKKDEAINAALKTDVNIPEDAALISDVIQITRNAIAKQIKEISAVAPTLKEDPERTDMEPVKEALEGILQRTITLVGLNPTRTDETWLWTNTLAGALLEVIRKLEEEE